MVRVARVVATTTAFLVLGLAVPVFAPAAAPSGPAAPQEALAPPDVGAGVLGSTAASASTTSSTSSPVTTAAPATVAPPVAPDTGPAPSVAAAPPAQAGPPAPTPRVIAGTVADPARWPGITRISYYAGGGTALVGTCTGTVVAPTWVLTAGHCIDPDPLIDTVIVETGAGEAAAVLRGVRHPAFLSTVQWDVGLFELAQPLQGTPAMQLAQRDEPQLVIAGTQAVTAGYGRTVVGQEPDLTLREGPTVLQPADFCLARWPGQFSLLSDLCADGVGRTATCQGDSGGPVAVLAPRGVVQVGIVSRGSESCADDVEVYTSVLAARSWIDSVIGAASEPPAATPPPEAAPAPADRGQVGRIYRTVFHRWPDPAVIAYWHGLGLAPDALAAALANTPEGQRTFAAIADAALVYQAYWHTFDRLPDQAAYDYWLDRMATGMTQGAFLAAVADSGESVRLTGHLPT